MVGIIIRLEGATVLLLSLYFYQHIHANWLLFLLLILAPDLAILFYRFGQVAGPRAYNIAHNYVLAAALLYCGVAMKQQLALETGLILAAHIGADRALGFGLKYPKNFTETHIQKL
jgi:hypothetical protein